MALPPSLARLTPVPACLICLYAFVIPLGTSPPYFVSVALVVPALLFFVTQPELRENRMLQLALAWIAFVVVMAVRADLLNAPGDHLRHSDNYFFISLAPLTALQIALAMRAVPFHMLALTSLASGLAGGALSLFWRADWSAGLQLFAHYATGGGGGNRNYLSIIAGLMILAALSLAIYHLLAATRLVVRLLLSAPFLAIGALAGVALVAMKSRTNMLATGAALTVWVVVCVAVLIRRQRRKQAMALLAVIVVGAAVLALAASQSALTDRLAAEGGIFANARAFVLVQLGWLEPQSVASGGYDQRLPLFQLATELIARKPWLGWGPDVAPLLEIYGRWDFIRIEKLNHFHNVYLEFTVGLGVVGAVLFLLVVGAMAHDILVRRSERHLDTGVLAALLPFALAAFTYFALVGLAESINRVEFISQSTILLVAFLLARCSIGASIERLLGPDGLAWPTTMRPPEK